jgi:hypothetical protein
MLYLADGIVFTCICRTQIDSYNKSGNFVIFCLYFVIFSTTQAKANSKNRYQQADLYRILECFGIRRLRTLSSNKKLYFQCPNQWYNRSNLVECPIKAGEFFLKIFLRAEPPFFFYMKSTAPLETSVVQL